LFRTGGEVTCSTTKTEEEEEEEEEVVEFTPDRAHSTKVPSAAEHRVWCVCCFVLSAHAPRMREKIPDFLAKPKLSISNVIAISSLLRLVTSFRTDVDVV
jgi:hypothetical protein